MHQQQNRHTRMKLQVVEARNGYFDYFGFRKTADEQQKNTFVFVKVVVLIVFKVQEHRRLFLENRIFKK